ncbi:hypothetical protein GE09DRAFT_1151575 [Coniochaeta sp. 2T2.1]|nr:hypothetical protein GE09DRAFT_1151575 [Coniochaeta sp. 2T2.1]
MASASANNISAAGSARVHWDPFRRVAAAPEKEQKRKKSNKDGNKPKEKQIKAGAPLVPKTSVRKQCRRMRQKTRPETRVFSTRAVGTISGNMAQQESAPEPETAQQEFGRQEFAQQNHLDQAATLQGPSNPQIHGQGPFLLGPGHPPQSGFFSSQQFPATAQQFPAPARRLPIPAQQSPFPAQQFVPMQQPAGPPTCSFQPPLFPQPGPQYVGLPSAGNQLPWSQSQQAKLHGGYGAAAPAAIQPSRKRSRDDDDVADCDGEEEFSRVWRRGRGS